MMMRKCAAVLTFVLTAGICIPAQVPPHGANATGSVSGTILDSVTRQPIEGVKIEVETRDTLSATSTDSAGRYRIPEVPLNIFFVSAEKAGYVSPSPGKNVVRPGKDIAVDLVLVPESSLHGRVLDRDTAEPVPGLLVSALLADFSTGMQRFVTAGSSHSKEDGSFEIRGLNGGDFLLEVSTPVKQKWRQTELTLSAKYARAYYPGVANLAAASAISLLTGASQRLDVRIAKEGLHQGLHKVSGEIVLPEAIKSEAVTALLFYLEPGNSRQISSAELTGSGPFELTDLSAGDYALLAWTGSRPRPELYMSDYRFHLGAEDLAAVEIRLEHCVPTHGSVHTDQQSGDLVSGDYEFYLAPLNRDALDIDLRGSQLKNGEFSLCVVPGAYHPVLRGLQDGWKVSQIFADRQPVDYAMTAGGGGGKIEVIVTRFLGRVTGTVNDGSGKPLQKIRVVLAPESIPQSMDSMPVTTTVATSDIEGRFSFSGVVPGRYRVIPLLGDDARLWADPDLLRAKSIGRDVIEIHPGQNPTVTVRP